MNIYLTVLLLFLVVKLHRNMSNVGATYHTDEIFKPSTSKASKTYTQTIFSTRLVERNSTLPQKDEQKCKSSAKWETIEGNDVWYCYDRDKMPTPPCFNYTDCFKDFNTITNEKHRFSYKCIPKSEYPLYSQGYGYVAIDSCPKDFNDTFISELCSENLIDALSCRIINANATVTALCHHGGLNVSGPFVVYNNSFVYKNKFCAICHQIKDFKYFNTLFVFNNLMLHKDLSSLKREDAYLLIALNKHEMIPPLGAKVQTCMYTTNDIYNCNRYTNPVVVPFGHSFEDEWCREIIFDQFKDFYNKEFIFSGQNIKRVDQLMSVLFKFDAQEEKESENDCLEWHEKMRETEECKDFDLFQNSQKELKFYLHSNTNLSSGEFLSAGFLASMAFESNISTTIRDKIYVSDYNKQIGLLEIVLRFTKTAFKHEADSFFDRIQSRVVTLFIQRGSESRKIQVDVLCNLTEPYTNALIEFKLFYINYPWLKLEKNYYADFKGYVATPMVSECSIWANMIPDNFNKLVVEKVHCSGQNNIIAKAELHIGNMVTYICFGISIVSLLILVFLQRKYGLVTNVPSSNSENIAISLILSNSLFVFGVRADVNINLCYIIGVCIHYLWLSVFIYMSIAVVSIANNLTKLRSRGIVSSNTEKRRTMLTLLGIVLPIPIVVTTIIVDKYGPPVWSVGYGTVPCFPRKYPANLVFFTGPIIFIICFNLLGLSYTICRVCGLRNQTSHIRQLNPYTEAKIYLRMSASSGVLWFVGILDAIFEEDWLSFVFTIICGLQGFFIALSNFTSKRFQITKENTPSGSTSVSQ